MKLKLFCQLIFLVCAHSHIFWVKPRKSDFKPNIAILENVLNFCEANGKKFITVTSYSKKPDNNISRQKAILFALAKKRKVYTRFLLFHEAMMLINMQEIDTTIILTNYKNIVDDEVIEKYLKLTSQTKIRSAIWVMSRNEVLASRPHHPKLDFLLPSLSKLRMNMFFYVVYDYTMEDESIGVVWNQIITLQDDPKVIVNELVFDNEYRIIER